MRLFADTDEEAHPMVEGLRRTMFLFSENCCVRKGNQDGSLRIAYTELAFE